MYSRNYLSPGQIPPGYSGIALREESKIDDTPRRPIYEDRPEDIENSNSLNTNNENKQTPPDDKIGRSNHDDILIAGIIMLLLSEGKCDELTLFLLGSLLLQ